MTDANINADISFGIYESPIGKILVRAQNWRIISLNFADDWVGPLSSKAASPIITQCFGELREYFEGRRKVFTLAFKASGTAFREKCWDALLKIPYGETISYKRLAANIGGPLSARAAGGANHNNPISIIIPCHRVIGSNGQLVGYGGGLWRKTWLLEHEKKYSSL
jgi:methylated-DNA-[protein]-cysteine S-methyltransferase